MLKNILFQKMYRSGLIMASCVCFSLHAANNDVGIDNIAGDGIFYFQPKNLPLQPFVGLAFNHSKSLIQGSIGAKFNETALPKKLGNLRPIESIFAITSLQYLSALRKGKLDKNYILDGRLIFDERTFSSRLGRFRPTQGTIRGRITKPSSNNFHLVQGHCKLSFAEKLWPTCLQRLRPEKIEIKPKFEKKASDSYLISLSTKIIYPKNRLPAWLAWLRPASTRLGVQVNEFIQGQKIQYAGTNLKAEIKYSQDQFPTFLGRVRPNATFAITRGIDRKAPEQNSVYAKFQFHLSKIMATVKFVLKSSNKLDLRISFSNDTPAKTNEK
jgi:hypothetical protein